MQVRSLTRAVHERGCRVKTLCSVQGLWTSAVPSLTPHCGLFCSRQALAAKAGRVAGGRRPLVPSVVGAWSKGDTAQILNPAHWTKPLIDKPISRTVNTGAAIANSVIRFRGLTSSTILFHKSRSPIMPKGKAVSTREKVLAEVPSPDIPIQSTTQWLAMKDSSMLGSSDLVVHNNLETLHASQALINRKLDFILQEVEK